MADDHQARGEDFERQAIKVLHRWIKLVDAADWYEKAAESFKHAILRTRQDSCTRSNPTAGSRFPLVVTTSIRRLVKVAQYALKVETPESGVKMHLINAGLCQICAGDGAAITTALDRYLDLDSSFAGTCEYKLLSDIASAICKEDEEKLTDASRIIDSLTKLDGWKANVFTRIKDRFKEGNLYVDNEHHLRLRCVEDHPRVLPPRVPDNQKYWIGNMTASWFA